MAINRLIINNITNHTGSTDSLYHLLIDTRNDLYFARTSKIKNEYINEIEDRINKIEKYLIINTDYKPNQIKITYANIRSKLKTDEALVEFFNYQLYDKGWKDSSITCALVVKSGWDYPVVIPLFENREINKLVKQNKSISDSFFYSNLYTSTNSELYKLIWKPLDTLLSEITTVYINSSGLLHKINIGAICNFEGKHLSESYSIHNLGADKLLNYKPTYLNTSTIKQAIVYGGIDYDKASNNFIKTEDTTDNQIGFEQVSTLASRSATAKFGDLPGTLTEAKNIQQISNKKGITTAVYSGENCYRSKH